MAGMRVKSKDSAKAYIDDESGELLDVLHELAHKYSGDVKVAKALLKDLVKIAVKVGVLYRHNQFDKKELAVGEKFRKKIKLVALTMVSYHEVAFTFDAEFLIQAFAEGQELLQQQISRHLKDKSKGRVAHVFGFYGQEELLEKLYEDSGYADIRARLAVSLGKFVEKL